jgi:hypothetical protein
LLLSTPDLSEGLLSNCSPYRYVSRQLQIRQARTGLMLQATAGVIRKQCLSGLPVQMK